MEMRYAYRILVGKLNMRASLGGTPGADEKEISE
jgi:hypothetical protein